MKSIVQITLFSVMLMIVSLGRLCGQVQACITFHSDYSGLEWDAAERARSTTAACSLRTLIADAGVSGFMSHSCQLSLNDTSLDAYDIRDIGDYVSLSIPEQGIQGIYSVTDIRKINPPKIPSSDEDESDDFVFSPVTAIFTHTSDDVWKLTFDNGEDVEVTSMHPFMDAVTDMWRPVSWLNAGDVVKTKSGIAALTSKEKLEGTHTVYNFTVDATHNYLVGDAGFLVHNSCGDLDKLANKFINNLTKSLKSQQIAEWWAKKGPVKGGDILDSFFGRGRFFETLLSKTKFSSWKWTNDFNPNFKAIDFYKKVGSKNLVASLKTTKSSPGEWLNYNSKHLDELEKIAVNKKITDGKTLIADEVWLYIVVPANKVNEWANFATFQNLGEKGIKFEVFTVESLF